MTLRRLGGEDRGWILNEHGGKENGGDDSSTTSPAVAKAPRGAAPTDDVRYSKEPTKKRLSDPKERKLEMLTNRIKNEPEDFAAEFLSLQEIFCVQVKDDLDKMTKQHYMLAKEHYSVNAQVYYKKSKLEAVLDRINRMDQDDGQGSKKRKAS